MDVRTARFPPANMTELSGNAAFELFTCHMVTGSVAAPCCLHAGAQPQEERQEEEVHQLRHCT